jgi:hypothetical protein
MFCWADVAELVDALDLGSSIARCESSSLSVRTTFLKSMYVEFRLICSALFKCVILIL